MRDALRSIVELSLAQPGVGVFLALLLRSILRVYSSPKAQLDGMSFIAARPGAVPLGSMLGSLLMPARSILSRKVPRVEVRGVLLVA